MCRWEAKLTSTLGPGYEGAAKHCLGTTHIMCFARTSLREHISDVHHAHVITGFGRVVANKAGAAVGPIACTLSGGRAYSMHSKRVIETARCGVCSLHVGYR